MTILLRSWLAILVLGLLLVASGSAMSPAADARAVPADSLIQPEELVKVLAATKGEKPAVLYVGFRALYARHIPGAQYIGPTSEERGMEQLRAWAKSVPRAKAIVLYCGCCPWEHCPNIAPAFQELRALGFTKVKALRIANNFGRDWMAKGYPVERAP